MIRIIFLLFLLVVSNANGSSELKSGLKFLGNKDITTGENYPYSQKAKINYSKNEPLSLPQDFILTFDFAVWKIDFFGYVFRLENEKQDRFIISYYHYGDPDYAYLKF